MAKAIKLHPEASASYKARAEEERIAFQRKKESEVELKNTQNRSMARKAFNKAIEEMHAGNEVQFEKNLQDAITLYPESSETFLAEVKTERAAYQKEKARDYYDQAIEFFGESNEKKSYPSTRASH